MSPNLSRWARRGAVSGALATAIVLSGALPASAALNPTKLVSYAADNSTADGSSKDASISTNGIFIAFESAATNLIAADTNGVDDIFVRNTIDNTIVRASVASDESEAVGGGSGDPTMNSDGRYVAFDSAATNLVADDTNDLTDSFVRDLVSGTTVRVSTATDGTEGDGYAGDPWISADGRYVVFESNSTNLVAGDTNGEADIFLRDTVAGTTVRVSVASDESEATGGSSDDPSISGDGRYVVFESTAINLVADDTNGAKDIFLRDVVAGTTERISVTSDEVQAASGWSGNPIISSSGKFVAYESGANDLVVGDTGSQDAFVRDLVAGTTVRVSVADDESQSSGSSWDPVVSDDGRYAAFESGGSNLVANDTNGVYDIFVRDLVAGTTTRVSLDSAGVEGNYTHYQATISGDGSRVAFESRSTNLVADPNPPVVNCGESPDDPACSWDIFVNGQDAVLPPVDPPVEPPVVLPSTGSTTSTAVIVALVLICAGTCGIRLGRRVRSA